MLKTDVLVIGAGAVGSAISRELSKYKLKVICVDKSPDIGGDASKSNSSIIHTGYDAAPGSLEARLVVAANPMYIRLTQELDVPFKWTGGLLPAFTDEEVAAFPAILDKAYKNGVFDIEYLSGKQVLEKEPEINPEVKAGLFLVREAVIDNFQWSVALAENANDNGVTFLLGAKVTAIHQEDGKITGAVTTAGEIQADYIVNAAALFCDEIAAMVGKNNYHVNPRKGQAYIVDRNTSCKVNHILYTMPNKMTKGKVVVPTVHGNYLVGPTAEDLPVDQKDNREVNREGLEQVERDIKRMLPNINLRDSITQFCGLRPNRNPEGVNIDVYDDLYGYVNISGVRSTGLTASVAIAKHVAHLFKEMGMPMEFQSGFNPIRKWIPRFNELPKDEQAALIQKNPLYGNVICRCETITEGEIVDAIHRPIPARSMDAIKRRLRPGMGRCQGGFCGPRVLDILARELNIPVEEVQKSNASGSYMVVGRVR